MSPWRAGSPPARIPGNLGNTRGGRVRVSIPTDLVTYKDSSTTSYALNITPQHLSPTSFHSSPVSPPTTPTATS